MPGSAALEELEELPPDEVVLPLVCSFSTSVVQEVSPLIMPRLAARLKASHRSASVVLDSTIAPPRTSERASKVTLSLSQCEIISQVRIDVLVEDTTEVKSASNGLQSGEVGNALKVGVVGNEETTTDGLERRTREVVQVTAGDESNVIAGRSQIRSRERLESTIVEAHGATDAGQGGHANIRGVDEGQVSGVLQVRQADLEIRRVGGEGQAAGDVGQGVDVHLGEVSVVVDVHLGNGFQLDTGQVGQGGIGNLDIVGTADASTKVEGLEGGQRNELDGVHTRQRVELEASKDGEALKVEDTADGTKLVSGDRSELSGVETCQVTTDGTNTIELDSAGGLLRDDHIALELRAVRKLFSIGVAGDLKRIPIRA